MIEMLSTNAGTDIWMWVNYLHGVEFLDHDGSSKILKREYFVGATIHSAQTEY